jgi:glycosyltransferase 2 family protein
VLAARVGLPVLALALLWQRLGAQAFRPSLAVVAPLPMLAALVLGGVAVAAQSARWRVLTSGAGMRLGRREALAECYRSSALNTVLPGGVVGDVLRAWRQRTRAPEGWRPAAGSVLADRAAGVCVLLAAAAVVLVAEAPPVAVAAAVSVACVALAVTWPLLRRLTLRQRAAVWGWSAVALAALVGLSVVVAVSIGVHGSAVAVITLGLGLLAGMAVPLNLGGWGPREAAGALAALLVGAPPAVGVAVAAGYGLLSTVSVLPGFVILAIPGLAGAVRRGPRQVELHAGVLAQDEAP